MKVKAKSIEPLHRSRHETSALQKAVELVRSTWTPGAGARRKAPVASEAERDLRNDAMLMGAGGKQLPGSTPLAAIAGVQPSTGKAVGTAVFVNGVGCSGVKARENLQQLADSTGYAMVGVYNATNGLLNDVSEVAAQKLDLTVTGPAKALAAVMMGELDAGRPLKLFGHSQGTVVIAQAIGVVRQQLEGRGLSAEQVTNKLRLLEVETFAPATASFPDGPFYLHHVNGKDPIAAAFGPSRSAAGQLIHKFVSEALAGSHDLTRYLSERKKWVEQNGV